jgi:hypothetical protein
MECEKISVCGRQSTQPEKSKRRQSRRELSEKLHVGRRECSGGFSSEHFWIDGHRLRDVRRHSAEKAVPLPSAARRLLNLLLTEGGDNAGGVVHEQDRSIKEDKKCGEPAGGP